jgi:uncharacterized protein (DUF2062 family)
MPDDQTPQAFRAVVVAPTYNNAMTLRSIVERSLARWPHLIVVNDGSTDGTGSILDQIRAAPATGDVDVVNHELNRGKGAALRTGFARARERGFTHAVTIDTDGQLDPEQIPELLDRARAAPRALVIGSRDARADDYPARSRLGRWLTTLAIRLETGWHVHDNQCGFRVYPLSVLDAVRCRMGRFSFETEIVTRALWAGFEVENVPVRCRYFPAPQRITHYRVVRDNLEGALIHALLLARALIPLRPGRTGSPAADRTKPAASIWTRLGRWLSPIELWRQVRRNDIARSTIAVGIGCGVFIANLPCYGLHTLLSLYVARRLHIHPVAVVLGSQASTPPLSPFLIAAGISVGFVILHGRLPQTSDFDPAQAGLLELFRRVLLEWTIGGIIVGAVLAIAAAVVTYALTRLFPVRSPSPEPAATKDAQVSG